MVAKLLVRQHVTLVVLLSLISILSGCKSSSRAKKHDHQRVVLTYVDNGVSCESCLQSLYIAKAIAKELSFTSDKQFVILNTNTNDGATLRKKCKLFAGILMISINEGDSLTAFKKFDMNESILYREHPQEFVYKIATEIRTFLDAEHIQ